MTVHLVIPDTQVKPGAPTNHLDWAGRYIVERKPDVVIHLGDHWDMPSLSSYDRGKTVFEGRRYHEDIRAGNGGLQRLTAPIRRARSYNPRLVLLRGNHEERILRAANDDSRMDGLIGYHDFNDLALGWEPHDFLEPVWIDGVCYSHYFANPLSGRPYSGAMQTRLKNIGHSFTMGHQQIYDTGTRQVMAPSGFARQRGLVAGAYYLHDEDYRGPQGNGEWRGLIVCHEVRNGEYDLMEVSMEYLCQRYEGMSLARFKRKLGLRSTL